MRKQLITSVIRAEAVMAAFVVEYEERLHKLKYGTVGNHLAHDDLVDAVALLACTKTLCDTYETGKAALNPIKIASLIENIRGLLEAIDAIPVELPNGEEKTTES